MAIQTVSSHVNAAKAFYDKESIWFALAHPFDWNIARLRCTNQGPYNNGTGHDLVFEVNGFEVTYSVPVNPTLAVATVVTGINSAAVLVDASLTGMASVSDSRVLLTAPTPGAGFASIEITTGSDVLGFLEGESITATAGGTSVPSPNPATRKLMEPFAFKKVVVKEFVIPDEDTAATIVSGNGGSTFNVSVASGGNVFTFKVNGSSDIVVTFPDSAALPMATVLNYINTAANGVSPDFASVATSDNSFSPPRVRITSPTEGSTSSIQVVVGSPVASLNISTGTTTGTDGGAIKFRQDQFATVDVADIYDEGARIIYISAEFKYDEVPLESWTQLGVLTDLEPIAGLESREYLAIDEVENFGILEFLEHRRLTARSIDQKELVRLAIEF